MQRKIEGKTFIEQGLEEQEIEKPHRPPSDFSLILRDRRTRLLIFFILFAVTVPILTFYFLIDQTYKIEDTSHSCLVDSGYRVSCGRQDITNSECNKIFCCYEPKTSECYHYIPSKYSYIKLNPDSSTYRSLLDATPFSNQSLQNLKLSVRELTAERVQIILHDPSILYENQEIANKSYEVKLDEYRLGVEVFLKNSTPQQPQHLILTTFRGPVIASDGYWEWTFQIPCEKLFGLGELVIKENETLTKIIYKNRNDHNTMPIFMTYSRGRFHGVVVEHDGPLEVKVLPSRLVVLRSLAGKKIILNLSIGPTPELVMRQQRVNELLQLPYWVLGAHICRDGLTTMDSALSEYERFMQNEKAIQFASDCIHENLYLMLSEANTNLPNLIEDLQRKSHFLMSVPPQILKKNSRLYNKAVELGILYKDKRGEIFNGSYLEQEVVYPHFSHASINTWMTELKANLPAPRIDGFILRDNWPEEESYEFFDKDYKFPYLTEELNSALSGTIPWSSLTYNGTMPIEHILKHNKYGTDQVVAFKKNLNYQFLMTSSYDYEVQEAALVQNINISWTSLKRAVTTTLYHSFFGNSLISVPVCGSTSRYDPELHEELCIRWYITAATFPLFRISSNQPRRDPSSLATGYAKNAALEALRRRYALLPYYYTTLSEGGPLVRPMFYDFYFDMDVLDLDEQYMVGNALLVAQPLLPASKLLRVYLPPSKGIWYEFWGGGIYNETGWNEMHIVETDWSMFIGQGHIVPTRNHKQSKIGAAGPEDTFSLVIALNCTASPCIAEGSLKFTISSLKLLSSEKGLTVANILQVIDDIGCHLNQRSWPNIIENVIIYGIGETVVRPSRFQSVDLCNQNEDEIYIEYYS